MSQTIENAQRLRNDGFAIVPQVINRDQVDALRHAIAALPAHVCVRRRSYVYGVRHLLDVSGPLRRFSVSPAIRELVEPILGPECIAVRATFFDKVPDANWTVAWHQDAVIAVKGQVDMPGFSAWSRKSGIIQVRPPEHILLQMLAVRVHLDDCPAENGALRVLAGSHLKLRRDDEILQCRSEFDEILCEVAAGGALVMRPLIVHASSPAQAPGRRRVVHLEFAATDLPGPLEWNWRLKP